MKKIFALAFFAALNLNLMATDIWGNNGIWDNSNNREDEETTDNNPLDPLGNNPIFGGGDWLGASRPGGWEPDENIGENEKDPAIPIGEGLLVLLAGGAFYVASKLKRKE